MPQNKIQVFLVSCLLFWATATSVNSQSESSSQVAEDRSQAVSAWFGKYDQIRRDAEMPLNEKLKYGSAINKALKSGGTLSESTRAFAERMVGKYDAAAAAMRAITIVPETRELQEGYTEYFTEMAQTFSECLQAKEMNDSERDSQALAKEKLETLNQKNKKIDADLRKQYAIAKHKHS